MRLISVVLGSTSMKAREDASAALLGYGFTFFDTKLIVKGGHGAWLDARLEGCSTSAQLGIKDDLYMTLGRGQADVKDRRRDQAQAHCHRLRGRRRRRAARAQRQPGPADHTAATVETGGGGRLWRRLIDTIRLWFA